MEYNAIEYSQHENGFNRQYNGTHGKHELETTNHWTLDSVGRSVGRVTHTIYTLYLRPTKKIWIGHSIIWVVFGNRMGEDEATHAQTPVSIQ